MKIGVVGTGSIGRRHIGNLLALGCEVVAMDVSEVSRAKAAAEHPHARYSDSLSFTGLDALVIATPAGNHLRWVEECVRRNLPFFVEKPIGTVGQIERWRELLDPSMRMVHMVGYMLRWHQMALSMRAIKPTDIGLALWWDAEKYGYRLEDSSHEIDLALWLGADGDVTLRYSTNDGVDALIGSSCVVSIRDRSTRYIREWNVSNVDSDVYVEAKFGMPDGLGAQMYFDEMAHFVECVRDFNPTSCTLADGLRVLEVCQKIEAARACV